MFQQGFVNELIQIDLHIFVLPGKPADKGQQEELLVVADADPELAGVAFHGLFRQAYGQMVLFQQLVGLEVEFFAGFGQFDVPGVPVEQLDAQLVFQALDPPAEGGLAGMLFFCGFGKAQFLCQDDKTVEGAEIHKRPSPVIIA